MEGTFLNEYQGGKILVWSFDGNLDYVGLKHTILAAVAIIFFLVLWLPSMLILLFIQCLRRHSHRRLLRWVNRLYPFFDSYFGPLKGKHHYWIGLGLLARFVLLVTSAATYLQVPFAAMVLIITFIFGSLVLSVYRQWQLGVLEGSFLLNLALFSSGALIYDAQEEIKTILVCLCLGIAFIQFLAIVGYHVWRRLQTLKKNTHRGDKGNNLQRPDPQQATTCQKVSVAELREPLLDSTVE